MKPEVKIAQAHSATTTFYWANNNTWAQCSRDMNLVELCNIGQGDSNANRDGNKINMRLLKLKTRFVLPNNAYHVVIRHIIYRTKKTQVGDNDINYLLDTTNYGVYDLAVTPYKRYQTDPFRFQIMSDKKYHYIQDADGGDDALKRQHYYKKNFGINKVAVFDGANTNVERNELHWCCAVSYFGSYDRNSNQTQAPTFHVELSFTDN